MDDALSDDQTLRYGFALEQIVEGPQEVEHLDWLTERLLEDPGQASGAYLSELGRHLNCSILDEFPEDGQTVLLVLCVPLGRVG